jgi:heat shock protein HslJ
VSGALIMANPGSLFVRAAGALLAGVVLAGCGAPAGRAAAPADARPASAAPGTSTSPGAPAVRVTPLSGTAWRLVEIQSMDDAVGTTHVSDPSRYTMRLNTDGSVAFRLDCNSATGTWSAEAAASDPSSGRFEFGPLAATTALCPPPSLDEQVTKQASYFRSYLLNEGRLYLSLIADGGIFVWEPVASGQ